MPLEQTNPALTAFAAEIGTSLVFGQVHIQRLPAGFELRHTADAGRASTDLRPVKDHEIRALAQFTASGAFRPLKSAPTLADGWRITARDIPALGIALNHLYPGAVADWHAARADTPPLTSYRQFTSRQTGMYRITTFLDDATAGAMIRACCHPDSCLKRRLWTVEGLSADPTAAKSLVPCLEPCAILLEFARKIARLEQQEAPPASAPPETTASPAECDFDAPNNPRRLRFVLEKKQTTVTPTTG